MTAADDRGLEDLLERLRTRFYGKYRGIVLAVEAPTMRIKAKVPSVLGEITTGWCMPCVPYAGKGVGFAFLPDVGSGVWIEFEGGDVSYPIWVGGYWRQGEFPADAADAADKPDAPDRVRVIVTKAPHKVKFDDVNGTITLSDPNDNTVTLDKAGITLANDKSTAVVSSSGITFSNGQSTVAVSSSSVSVNNGQSTVAVSSSSVSVNNGALEVK